ncbi:MAG: hypothetical protein JNL73_00090 [Anaerolineales bacterium]|nr:hypothetical protein [Anaerolineales bacterium]
MNTTLSQSTSLRRKASPTVAGLAGWSRRRRALAGLAVTLLVLVLGYLAIRPWHLRWGATDAEVAAAMPGDLSGRRWTRAVTIDASPEQIWPWLVQWGQGRGGWYSYDWLENLFGFDIHSAEAILPEHQDLAVGDPICMAAGVCVSTVVVIEPNRWLGWQSTDEAGRPVWSFTLGLNPIDPDHTRLIVRESFSPDALPAAVLVAIEIPDAVMELKALDTVKRRAEGALPSVWLTVFEIVAWLAALLCGLLAGMLAIARATWLPALAVGVAAVIVLLGLTFLFPPLWLRAALDLGLVAGLIWSGQKASSVRG